MLGQRRRPWANIKPALSQQTNGIACREGIIPRITDHAGRDGFTILSHRRIAARWTLMIDIYLASFPAGSSAFTDEAQ